MDLLVISRYRFPVDNIVESLHIIGAQIFIFQVVSVFPDIDAQDRHEAAAFDDRVILVRAGRQQQVCRWQPQTARPNLNRTALTPAR